MHGWRAAHLEEICAVEYGDRVVKKRDGGTKYPVYGGGGATFHVDRHNREDCWIVSRFGMSPECVRRVDGKFFLNDSGLTVSSLDEKTLIQEYLDWYLLFRQSDIFALGRGSAQKNLDVPAFRALEISFPIAVVEQRRIVAILDEAFEGIRIATANTEKNLANASELFDAVSDGLFAAAAHWQAYTLEQLLESNWIVSHLDGNHGSEYPRKEEFVANGVPYISANCIVDEAVDFDLAKYLAPERADRIRKGVARDRDVLFAHNATVGPVALLRTEEPRVILGTSLTYYRCNEAHISPEYLAHYMRTPLFRRQYELVMRQSTRNQVPITKQREFTHVVPPIEDQRQIAATLDQLEAERQTLLAGIQAKMAQASSLKQSILSCAFSGQLTATKGLAA